MPFLVCLHSSLDRARYGQPNSLMLYPPLLLPIYQVLCAPQTSTHKPANHIPTSLQQFLQPFSPE